MSPEVDTLSTDPHAGREPRARVEVEELPRWRRRLTVTVPPERVRAERRRIAMGYARKLKLPGFRPGKAPLDVVSRRFKADIEQDLVSELLRGAIREGIEERGIEPISPPVVGSVDVRDDELRAVAELDVRPEIALSRYRGFRVERPAADVPAEAIEHVLQRLRDERAELRPVDRPAARGDVVVVDARPVEGGGKAIEGHEILLGSGGAGADVEAQLEGAVPGEEREVVLGGNAAESEAGGAGAGALEASSAGPAVPRSVWHVRVAAVNERVLPPLDDAFAASVSRAASLAELRGQIAENLRLEAEARAEREVRDRLLDAIAEANDVQLPESMVDRYLDRMLRPEEDPGPGRSHAHGERYEEAREHDPRIAEILRPAAERNLRRLLILETVGRGEALEPADEQLDAYLRDRLEPGSSLEEARRALERAGRLDELRHRLRTENVFEFLKRNSTIVAEDRSAAEPTA